MQNKYANMQNNAIVFCCILRKSRIFGSFFPFIYALFYLKWQCALLAMNPSTHLCNNNDHNEPITDKQKISGNIMTFSFCIHLTDPVIRWKKASKLWRKHNYSYKETTTISSNTVIRVMRSRAIITVAQSIIRYGVV